MSNQKRTKIVATLGPATNSEETLKHMMLEGVDVFRVNFSHADYDTVKNSIATIRRLSEELDLHVAILGDLQGPKLRVGVMKEEVVLQPGDELLFCTGEEFEGTKEKVYMNYDDLSWTANKSNYLGLLACLVNIWALGFLIKDTPRRSH